MKSFQVFAHRGFFRDHSERNSLVAFRRAIDNGFSIETDIRSLNGELLVSHDPLTSDYSYLTFNQLLEEIESSSFPSSISLAINIKSDGLCPSLLTLANKFPTVFENSFVFDMSFPDSLQFVDTQLNVYRRLSEYEPLINCDLKFTGSWIDCFGTQYDQLQAAVQALNNGGFAAIVSPELHGHSFQETWEKIKSLQLHKNPKFQICTDFPSKALNFFN